MVENDEHSSTLKIASSLQEEVVEHLRKHNERIESFMTSMMKKLEKDKSPYIEAEDCMANGIEWFPKGFSMPQFPPFNGKGSPASQMNQIVMVLSITGLSMNQIACLFPTTSEGGTVNWYNALPTHIRIYWKSLAVEFIEFYACNIKKKTMLEDREAVRQKPNEELESIIRDRGKH